MTNLMAFWSGGTPPSPWQKVTTWDGKYLRFGNTYSQHGTTGGSATHYHTTTNWSVGNNSTSSQYTEIGSVSKLKAHTHAAPASPTVASANNDPLYYTLELIYMDLAEWESSERRFPQGTIVLSDAVISWSPVARFTSADGKLIKLGTAGSTGGSNTASHTVTGNLQDNSSGVSLDNFMQQWSAPNNVSHGHAISATSSAKTTLPKHVRTRLYRFTETSDRAEAGIICFVDNTPTAKWTLIDWSDCFLYSSDGNPNTQGVSTHNHTGVSCTSSGYTATASAVIYGENSAAVAANPHTHNVTFDLATANHEPPFVNLVPVKLTTTLYHVNSYDYAYVEGFISRKTMEQGLSLSMRAKASGSEFITADAVLKKARNVELLTGMPLAARFTKTDPVDMVLVNPAWRAWMSSMKLILTTASLSTSLRLIQPRQTTMPVLDSILKAWTSQLDKIQMRISMMDLSNKLDYATGSEMDLKWGAVYDLPRFADESDEHYRKRIKTCTLIKTGSGTKTVCESVLDEIVDENGASRVETWEPGKVRIYWDSNTAPHLAYERKRVIDYTIPLMLAAGIDWEMFLECVELPISTFVKGSDYIQYCLDALIESQDRLAEYYIRPRIMDRHNAELTSDALLKIGLHRAFLVDLIASHSIALGIDMGGLMRKSFDIAASFDLLEKAYPIRTYRMDQMLLRRDIDRALGLDSLLRRSFRRVLFMTLIAVFHNYLGVLTDLRLLRYDINKLYLLDSLFQKRFPAESAMDLLLVSK